jgi:hypothetical protein
MSNTQTTLTEALDDGRKAVKWGTDYFLKAHTAPTELYGQVGLGDLDHSWWGRPEDMTMPRPAYMIDTSKPGKLASRSFFPTYKRINSRRATNPRHPQFCHLHFEDI